MTKLVNDSFSTILTKKIENHHDFINCEENIIRSEFEVQKENNKNRLERDIVEYQLDNFETFENFGKNKIEAQIKTKSKLKIKNRVNSNRYKNINREYKNEENQVCYGSPAIWLKNIKKIDEGIISHPIQNESKIYRSNTKLLFNNNNLNNNQNKNVREIQKDLFNFKIDKSLEKIKPTNIENQIKPKRIQIFQKKSESPVLIKNRNFNEVHYVENKKIALYQKNPSFTQSSINRLENFSSLNESNNKRTHFKTLIYNSSIKIRSDGDNKFSNINQGIKFCTNLTENKDKADIEETIISGSNMDISCLIISKEIIDNNYNANANDELKALLKNKLRKINTNLDSSENLLYKSSLKGTKTYPNSKDSSPLNSETNSEKDILCNNGSRSDLLSKKENCLEKEKSSGKTHDDLLQSDEMFKTICGGVQLELDSCLHRIFRGKNIKWKAGEIIDTGSSSIVYKALNEDDGSIFVVKRYLGLNEPKMVKTFHNEVQIYEQLDHPNIIKFLGSESINESLFIYLEYISGGSIKYILEKYGPLNENLIKIFIKQILDGLEYLHSKGIVHRDLKSANLLLDVKGNIKLFDFGCSGQFIKNSNLVEQIAPELNINNSEEFLDSLKGTLPWMAPEVVCQKRYGKKADVWSLGCTILEMASGNPPWGKLDNFYQAMNKIGRSSDIPEIPAILSEELKSFLLMCFKRDPKERPSVRKLKEHIFFAG